MKIKNKTPLLEVPSSGVLSSELRVALAKSAENFIARGMKGESATSAALLKKLEQYYTSSHFALELCRHIEAYVSLVDYVVIEPSAGSGTILSALPRGSIGMDVDPKSSAIIKANYLETRIVTNRDIAVVGNPPFHLAVDFFEHAAKQARVIAMIVPLTFRRASVINKLDSYFHLVAEIDVPSWAFLRAGRPYNVAAILQIWEKRTVKRAKLPKHTEHADFTFGPPAGAVVAIQRIGANASLVHHGWHRSDQAHLFVTASREEYESYVEAMFNSIDLADEVKNTSAVPYVTTSEIYGKYIELERVIYG